MLKGQTRQRSSAAVDTADGELGKFSSGITAQVKSQIWEQIA